MRFKERGVMWDLESSITLQEIALAELPAADPQRCNSLSSLASSLEKCFQHTGNTKDIDRAMQLRQEALDSANPTNRILFLHNVSYGLSERGGIKDLDGAIDIDHQVLALRPPGHVHRALSLNNLALNLYKRSKYWLEGHKADLDNTIDLYGQTLLLLQTPAPRHVFPLQELAEALMRKYKFAPQSRLLDHPRH
jgi:hypothetical protein